ncbi:CHAT domain-containing protein [Falsiroseomonas stagni]|uniref:CHAT domain-containing protein n=1 Tax=Falsiroseomonas stagni TaxID=484882 RepID=UPI001C312879|nr:CHAT domain-containing protein [Falsiroseomonas stagni]
MAATDRHGIVASVEALSYGCRFCLTIGDVEEGERVLGLLKMRLADLGDRSVSTGYGSTVSQLESELAALRASGVALTDFVEVFFDTAGRLLGVVADTSRTPESAAVMLQRVAELPVNQAQDGLTTLVKLASRIVDHRFGAGDRGEVLEWLDIVEPYIPRCDPEQALRLAGDWSTHYRVTALDGGAERLADEVWLRFEAMIGAIPAPLETDASAWPAHKASVRHKHERYAALDHAIYRASSKEELNSLLAGTAAHEVPPDMRPVLERLFGSNSTQRDGWSGPTSSDPYANVFHLREAYRLLDASRWSEAGELLARLLNDGVETDGDLAWSVPYLLARCVIATAPDRPRVRPVATALLKHAIRGLERQKLEVAAKAAGALSPVGSGPTNDAYEMLRDLLLGQSRVGEAIRVEALRIEQACRLPNAAKDASLRALAAERLPAFPAERVHWEEWQRSAAQLRPGGGSRWLALMAAQPPEIDLAHEAGFGGQSPAAGELSLGFLAAADEIQILARDHRGIEHLRRVRIPAIEFNRELLAFQMVVRNVRDDEAVAASAARLGAILFDPLTDLLRQEAPHRLLIEPTGAISHVPFAALRVDGAWLAEQYEILLPGGWPTPANDDARSNSLVSVCVSQRGRRDVLQWVEKDRKEIEAFATATGMDLRSIPEPEARRDAVLDLLSSPPRILHFSCHFDAKVVDMAKAAFRLADGDQLTVEDLSRCPLSGVDLALLLGCETASRPPAALDSAIVGVDAALLRLGVRSVVSTQWPVDDQASHLFLKALLAALREAGVSKAAAVRQAQLAVIRSDTGMFRHPIHWAAFSLVGQG